MRQRYLSRLVGHDKATYCSNFKSYEPTGASYYFVLDFDRFEFAYQGFGLTAVTLSQTMQDAIHSNFWWHFQPLMID